jgi:hypothetical protein
MMILAILALGYAGLTALCLAMAGNYAQVFGRNPPARHSKMLRLAGSLLLLADLLAATRIWGWPIGTVTTLVTTSIGGLLLIFLLPYAPRFAAAAATLCACAGLIGASPFY